MPSSSPSVAPTLSASPTQTPSAYPSVAPSLSASPTTSPSSGPSQTPSLSTSPSSAPSTAPSLSSSPTVSYAPSSSPSLSPTLSPTMESMKNTVAIERLQQDIENLVALRAAEHQQMMETISVLVTGTCRPPAWTTNDCAVDTFGSPQKVGGSGSSGLEGRPTQGRPTQGGWPTWGSPDCLWLGALELP